MPCHCARCQATAESDRYPATPLRPASHTHGRLPPPPGRDELAGPGKTLLRFPFPSPPPGIPQRHSEEPEAPTTARDGRYVSCPSCLDLSWRIIQSIKFTCRGTIDGPVSPTGIS